ncbi:MAG: FixH family protein [Acidobacteriia bacterium]|nr:FixH family protein [Terriglobia bacterium]
MIGCNHAGEATNRTELQRLRSGELEVVLLSPRDALRHGSDTFVIEFRSLSNGSLIDVGTVRSSANMPMPGMTMFGNIDVQRTSVVGRYAADAKLEMGGTWRMTIEWDGPMGHGSLNFSRSVQ